MSVRQLEAEIASLKKQLLEADRITGNLVEQLKFYKEKAKLAEKRAPRKGKP